MIDQTPKSIEVNIEPGVNMNRPGIPYDFDLEDVVLPEGVTPITQAASLGKQADASPFADQLKSVVTTDSDPTANDSDPNNNGVTKTRIHVGGVTKEERIKVSHVIDAFLDIDPDKDSLRDQAKKWSLVGRTALYAGGDIFKPIRPEDGWRKHGVEEPKKPKHDQPLVRRTSSSKKPHDTGNVPIGNYSPAPIKLASKTINPNI